MSREDLRILDTWADEGIYIIKPRNEKALSPTGAIQQAESIALNIGAIAQELGCKTVCWDTITETGKQVLDEAAQSPKGGGNKYTIGDSTFHAPSLADYGFVQSFLRNEVRLPLVQPEVGGFHLFTILHETTQLVTTGATDAENKAIKKPLVIGPDAGGPASIEDWGKNFPVVWRVSSDEKGKRILQLDEIKTKIGSISVPMKARTAVRDPKVLAGQPTIEIPADGEKAVELLSKILGWMGIDPSNPEKTGYIGGTIYGPQGGGKTSLFSTFLAIPGFKPCLYVAADGHSEFLRSFRQEALGEFTQSNHKE